MALKQLNQTLLNNQVSLNETLTRQFGDLVYKDLSHKLASQFEINVEKVQEFVLSWLKGEDLKEKVKKNLIDEILEKEKEQQKNIKKDLVRQMEEKAEKRQKEEVDILDLEGELEDIEEESEEEKPKKKEEEKPKKKEEEKQKKKEEEKPNKKEEEKPNKKEKKEE